MKVSWETEVNGVKLLVGNQNFKTETVDVVFNDEKRNCPMFQDEEGDIGFIFEGEGIYFSYMNKN